MAGKGTARKPWGPKAWFITKGNDFRFSPAACGMDLSDRTPFAKEPGVNGRLYVYREGRYQPEGEESIGQRITQGLEKGWHPSHTSQTIEWVRQRAPTFDGRPPSNVVIVRNGIVKVSRNGPRFIEGDHHDLLTPVCLPVEYDPAADCPAFRRFLETAIREPELIGLVQEIIGYSLVPDTRQQKAFLHYGVPGAGKSTLVRTHVALLGEENCSGRTLHDLIGNRFATYDLYGKLLNAAPDLSAQELKSSARFRAITGGDLLQAEQKHQPAFSFFPYARLVFSANEFPVLSDPTEAMFDRWIVVPWEAKFRGTEAEDRDLMAKLATPAELSGILNFALGGLQRLLRRGRFAPPQLADQALDEFRQRADLVRVFLDEADLANRVERVELFGEYRNWCLQTEHRPMTRNQFYNRIRRIGIAEVKSGGVRYFQIG
jgi:putative DNA primase/helicase